MIWSANNFFVDCRTVGVRYDLFNNFVTEETIHSINIPSTRSNKKEAHSKSSKCSSVHSMTSGTRLALAKTKDPGKVLLIVHWNPSE